MAKNLTNLDLSWTSTVRELDNETLHEISVEGYQLAFEDHFSRQKVDIAKLVGQVGIEPTTKGL